MNLSNISKFIRKLYFRTTQSIAFYPVLISTGFLMVGLSFLLLEHIEWISISKDNISPYLFIQDGNTARTLLSVFIGGTLSLTVFSFSMVMVVLNQASSSYSPRLLPGLISDPKHQIILGIYIGTIVYSILVLITIYDYDNAGGLKGFSVLLGAVFGIICIFTFVYFLHSISQAIMIGHIMEDVERNTLRSLKGQRPEAAKEVSSEGLKPDNCQLIISDRDGYYAGWESSILPEEILDLNNKIEILPYKNKKIYLGDPLILVDKALDEELRTKLQQSIDVSKQRNIRDGFFSGLVQLMDIALRAMSPGINDPGTAIEAIDSIFLLLRERLQRANKFEIQPKEDCLKIIINQVDISEIRHHIFMPLRQYCKQDTRVMTHILRAMKVLMNDEEIDGIHLGGIRSEIVLMKQDIEATDANQTDIHEIEQIV